MFSTLVTAKDRQRVPSGLEKGRDLFYSSGVIHYELKSVRLISEVLKT